MHMSVVTPCKVAFGPLNFDHTCTGISQSTRTIRCRNSLLHGHNKQTMKGFDSVRNGIARFRFAHG